MVLIQLKMPRLESRSHSNSSKGKIIHSSSCELKGWIRLGIDYYTFHDRDIAPEGSTLIETNKNLDEIVALAKDLQAKTGVKLLWGTANLFSHPVKKLIIYNI